LLESFDRRELLSRRRSYGCDARTRRDAVDQHRASSTLAFAATILAAGQIQIISQDTEQAAIGSSINSKPAPIDKKLADPLHSLLTPDLFSLFLCHNNKPADGRVQQDSIRTTGSTGITGKLEKI
jgi:hypothetical protein